MSLVSVHDAQVRAVGTAKVGQVRLSVEGLSSDIILSGFVLLRRSLDNSLAVYAPKTRVQGSEFTVTILPIEVYAQIVAAFDAADKAQS